VLYQTDHYYNNLALHRRLITSYVNLLPVTHTILLAGMWKRKRWKRQSG